jgi:fused signal recognition particle receptor
MFKFLKEKLKSAVSVFSKKVEEEGEKDERVQEPILEQSYPEKTENRSIRDFIEMDEAPEASEIPNQKQSEDESIRALQLSEEKKRIVSERNEFARQELERAQHADGEKRRREEENQERLKQAEEEKLAEELKQEEASKKQGFFSKIFSRKKEEKKHEEIKEEPGLILEKEEFEKKTEDFKSEDDKKDEPEPRKGIFTKIKETITTVRLSDEKFNELFWELEVTMLENNVAVEVIEKIKEDLRHDLTSGKLERRSVEQAVHDSLKDSIQGLFAGVHGFDLVERIKSKQEKPFVISFIGVNGSGKTTTMAKVASLLLKNKISCVFAASDTFRAAAIQQLQEHADRLGIRMIKHDYESDPAAVAFDAIKHAKAKGIDVVLIDTAGRLHTNDNLMNELKKLVRVNPPDLKIFIGEAITGNDCVEQAKLFNESVGIDAIILAKADIDEKGGAAISVSFVTKKPILYLGTGQSYDDLVKFRPELVIESMGL